MKRGPDKYADYVDHPRYGRGPHYTDLNPDPFALDVSFHINATSPREIQTRCQTLTGTKCPYDLRSYANDIKRIPDTAIVADLARQTPTVVPVTHYFDVRCVCRDCKRPFIFFAQEQKYWYEELGFSIYSGAARCVDCRKRQQGIVRERERYEELFHIPNRTEDENLEMADCSLSLMESSAFNHRQTQRVRMLLNRISPDADDTTKSRCDEFRARVLAIESQDDQQSDAPAPR